MKRHKIFRSVICFLITISMLSPVTAVAKTGYWCDDGGKHHSTDVGIGWYKTYDDAEQGAFHYMDENNDSGHYLVQECDLCGLFTVYVTLHNHAKPDSVSISKIISKSKAFTVKWNRVQSYISGYQVQYATDNKFKKNKKTVTIHDKDSTSKTIKKLKVNKKYFIRIRTYRQEVSNKTFSSWSAVKSIKTLTDPVPTSLTKLSGGNKQITVKWKKVKNVQGYQIQYSTSSKFKKAKKMTVKENDKTSKKIKKLKNGRKYYVRVRTYKVKNDKKVYSSWSKKKSVVTSGYWCDEGGTHHSREMGIGWYKTYDEAWKATLKYEGEHQEIQQCDYCGLYTAYVRK